MEFTDDVDAEYVDYNTIHINFNLPEYEHLLAYRPLYDYVKAQNIAHIFTKTPLYIDKTISPPSNGNKGCWLTSY